MDNILLTYNRDINITGAIQPNDFVPEYGTNVSFEYLDFSFKTENNHVKNVEKELNNMLTTYNLIFTQQTEEEARSFVSFFEKLSTGVSGAGTSFDFHQPNADGVAINFPTGNIYRKVSGLFVEDYSTNFHNGLFDLELTAKTNLESQFLNWRTSTFLNSGFLKVWDSGVTYDKFDIIYVDKTAAFLNRQEDDRERFFYVSDEHSSADLEDLLLNFTGSQSIRKDFFFEPDDNATVNFGDSVNVLKFDSSIMEGQNLSTNKNVIKSLNLSFSNRSNKETFALLHFLEHYAPPRFFALELPKLFTRKKFFKVKNFSHTFVYKDCNDVSVELEEVVEPQRSPQTVTPFHLSVEYNESRKALDAFPLLTEQGQKISLEYVASFDDLQKAANTYLSGDQRRDFEDVGQTALNFRLTWENLGSASDEGFDLDIYVRKPNSSLFNYSVIGFGTNNPGLIRDERGEDFNTIGDVGGPENLFWKDAIEVQAGTYQVWCQLFNKNTSFTGCKYTLEVFESDVLQTGWTGSFLKTDDFDSKSPEYDWTV